MLGGLTFTYEMHDRTDRLDPHAWRAVLECALARSGEGLVVCDGELTVLFSTPRAVHFLARLGMGPERALPEHVAALVNAQLAGRDASRVDRVPPLRSGSAVYLHATPIRGVPPARVALWLREEVLRDDLLYASLKERFGISPREFQLAQLVRKGLSNRHIAEQLRLAESTVKVYLHRLYRACGVSSRTGLIALLERLAG
jgi:DNA-binding CsgD family transcriptional regulator